MPSQNSILSTATSTKADKSPFLDLSLLNDKDLVSKPFGDEENENTKDDCILLDLDLDETNEDPVLVDPTVVDSAATDFIAALLSVEDSASVVTADTATTMTTDSSFSSEETTKLSPLTANLVNRRSPSSSPLCDAIFRQRYQEAVQHLQQTTLPLYPDQQQQQNVEGLPLDPKMHFFLGSSRAPDAYEQLLLDHTGRFLDVGHTNRRSFVQCHVIYPLLRSGVRFYERKKEGDQRVVWIALQKIRRAEDRAMRDMNRRARLQRVHEEQQRQAQAQSEVQSEGAAVMVDPFVNVNNDNNNNAWAPLDVSDNSHGGGETLPDDADLLKTALEHVINETTPKDDEEKQQQEDAKLDDEAALLDPDRSLQKAAVQLLQTNNDEKSTTEDMMGQEELNLELSPAPFSPKDSDLFGGLVPTDWESPAKVEPNAYCSQALVDEAPMLFTSDETQSLDTTTKNTKSAPKSAVPEKKGVDNQPKPIILLPRPAPGKAGAPPAPPTLPKSLVDMLSQIQQTAKHLKPTPRPTNKAVTKLVKPKPMLPVPQPILPTPPVPLLPRPNNGDDDDDDEVVVLPNPPPAVICKDQKNQATKKRNSGISKHGPPPKKRCVVVTTTATSNNNNHIKSGNNTVSVLSSSSSSSVSSSTLSTTSSTSSSSSSTMMRMKTLQSSSSVRRPMSLAQKRHVCRMIANRLSVVEVRLGVMEQTNRRLRQRLERLQDTHEEQRPRFSLELDQLWARVDGLCHRNGTAAGAAATASSS